MLVKHNDNVYSWGEGTVHTGAKAKQKALYDGAAKLGEKAFRVAARQSGVHHVAIELAVAESRAKGTNITRDNTRTGDDENDQYGDSDTGDINGTVAKLIAAGHGKITYSCGHTSQCRCMAMAHAGATESQINRTVNELCYTCKNAQ